MSVLLKNKDINNSQMSNVFYYSYIYFLCIIYVNGAGQGRRYMGDRGRKCPSFGHTWPAVGAKIQLSSRITFWLLDFDSTWVGSVTGKLFSRGLPGCGFPALGRETEPYSTCGPGRMHRIGTNPFSLQVVLESG